MRNQNKQPNNHSGFNLIESAIVLGIVGLVIGGIWVAASQISYKMRTKETYEGVSSALQKMKELFPPDLARKLDSSVDLSPLSTQLFPQSWQHGTSYIFIRHPLSKTNWSNIGFATDSRNINGKITTLKGIAIYELEKKACVNLGMLFAPRVGKDIWKIRISSTSILTPPTLNQLETTCRNTGETLVVFIDLKESQPGIY